ncbi:MAG: hypothetical protein JXA73_05570, partial [Acidobacteria bacterium]|nr:hypothetical protein [Acidobacteriota bacterium]
LQREELGTALLSPSSAPPFGGITNDELRMETCGDCHTDEVAAKGGVEDGTANESLHLYFAQ